MNFMLVSLGLLCLTLSTYGQGTEKSECEKAREKAQKSNTVGKLIPNCEPSGEYSALQCHHSSRFCQCWKPDGTPITQPSRKITACECFMQKYAVENGKGSSINGRPVDLPAGTFIPKCNANGTFESKQCDPSTKLCWCVDKKGKQTSDKKVEGSLTCP